MCRTCKKKCDDIPKHMMTVHKFSETFVEAELKKNLLPKKNGAQGLRKLSVMPCQGFLNENALNNHTL